MYNNNKMEQLSGLLKGEVYGIEGSRSIGVYNSLRRKEDMNKTSDLIICTM